jgi:hypothetical protein
VNEDQTIFIQAVRAAESLLPAVRERAVAVRFFERSTFDASYLDFLREQIALGARGPEWTAILAQRLSALSPYCDLPTLVGTISAQDGDYRITVDPSSRQVIHHERYETAGTPDGSPHVPPMAIKWDQCKDEFASDGALRDIQVVDATLADWQRVLDFLRASASKLKYTVDGTPTTLPSEVSPIIETRSIATPLLLFRWGDIEFATHFFCVDDLEFDFRSEEIRGQPQLDQLLSFLSGVGQLLGKTILVYNEGWEMNPFFIYDGQRDEITYAPQSI